MHIVVLMQEHPCEFVEFKGNPLSMSHGKCITLAGISTRTTWQNCKNDHEGNPWSMSCWEICDTVWNFHQGHPLSMSYREIHNTLGNFHEGNPLSMSHWKILTTWWNFHQGHPSKS